MKDLQVRAIYARLALREQKYLAKAWRQRFRMLPNAAKDKMVLKIMPYAWQMLDDRDSEALQFGLIADTGLHQYLRSVNRPKRQDHLKIRANAARLAIVGNLHACSSFTVDGQPRDQGVRENSEIRPVHKREGIRTENGLTF